MRNEFPAQKDIWDILSATVVQYSEIFSLLGKTELRPSKWLRRDKRQLGVCSDPQAPSAADFRFRISYDIPMRRVSGILNQDCGVQTVHFRQQNSAPISREDATNALEEDLEEPLPDA